MPQQISAPSTLLLAIVALGVRDRWLAQVGRVSVAAVPYSTGGGNRVFGSRYGEERAKRQTPARPGFWQPMGPTLFRQTGQFVQILFAQSGAEKPHVAAEKTFGLRRNDVTCIVYDMSRR